ncbi:adenosine nucleotide hydrolase [beta proteobacterium AAP99]|nr:adenosine nucleotide hydrolase [beta proteobacterium AAP99]
MSTIVSYSGGKDSTLALWRAQQLAAAGALPAVTATLTALEETGQRARSHGVSRALLQAQARALGLASHFIEASWTDYEARFVAQLQALAAQGVTDMVFGDIDLQPHRDWEEQVCARAGLRAHLPLWLQPRRALVDEFLAAGFKARVVCVDGRFLDECFVGCEFDAAFLARLPPNVDACGENGEFHTFVYDGPNFRHAVPWVSRGCQTTMLPPEFGSQPYHFDLLDLA